MKINLVRCEKLVNDFIYCIFINIYVCMLPLPKVVKMRCDIDVYIYANGTSFIGKEGMTFESDNYVIMTLIHRRITLDGLRDMIQLKYKKVSLKDDRSIQAMITKHLQS